MRISITVYKHTVHSSLTKREWVSNAAVLCILWEDSSAKTSFVSHGSELAQSRSFILERFIALSGNFYLQVMKI